MNAPTDVFAKPAAGDAMAAEQRLLAAIGIAAGESGLVTNGRVLLLRSKEDGAYTVPSQRSDQSSDRMSRCSSLREMIVRRWLQCSARMTGGCSSSTRLRLASHLSRRLSQR